MCNCRNCRSHLQGVRKLRLCKLPRSGVFAVQTYSWCLQCKYTLMCGRRGEKGECLHTREEGEQERTSDQASLCNSCHRQGTSPRNRGGRTDGATVHDNKDAISPCRAAQSLSRIDEEAACESPSHFYSRHLALVSCVLEEQLRPCIDEKKRCL